MNLSKKEILRYSRQIKLPNVGVSGQIKLKSSKVLVVGAGGLGSPVLLYLAAAGVGNIGIVEFDKIDISNLQRQILYETSASGSSKLFETEKKLKAINTEINLDTFEYKLSSKNSLEIFKNYDLIIDTSDNFQTRYLVNDTCEILNKPYVYGAIYQFEGQVSVFNLNGSATYRDLFPEPPEPEMAPNCAESGVFGPLAGIIGSIQANEAIKIITNIGTPLVNKLFILDSLEMEFRKISLKVDTTREKVVKLIDYEKFCGFEHENNLVNRNILREWRDAEVTFHVIDVREPEEREIEDFGGENIPLSEILDSVFNEEMKVVFYCATGKRAKLAAQKCRDRFPNTEFYYIENPMDLE